MSSMSGGERSGEGDRIAEINHSFATLIIQVNVHSNNVNSSDNINSSNILLKIHCIIYI